MSEYYSELLRLYDDVITYEHRPCNFTRQNSDFSDIFKLLH